MALSDAKGALVDIHQDLDEKKKHLLLVEDKVHNELLELEANLKADLQSRVRFDQQITTEYQEIRKKLEKDAHQEANIAENTFRSIFEEAKANISNFQDILNEKIQMRIEAQKKFNNLRHEAEQIKANIIQQSQNRRNNMKTSFDQLMDEMKKKKQDLVTEKEKLKRDSANIAARILEKYEEISGKIEKAHIEKKEAGLSLMGEIQETLKETHKHFS
ncbi:unnamed protein product [Blepharisma stoltei]|uniref:Uncharacterized protein n=1 Tax=Blepharisma stoltei TaxID=1481888 RepID=A0AAU9JUF8_9CILI|nr:unnamed protein product [Blepharisma stoltei]